MPTRCRSSANDPCGKAAYDGRRRSRVAWRPLPRPPARGTLRFAHHCVRRAIGKEVRLASLDCSCRETGNEPSLSDLGSGGDRPLPLLEHLALRVEGQRPIPRKERPSVTAEPSRVVKRALKHRSESKALRRQRGAALRRPRVDGYRDASRAPRPSSSSPYWRRSSTTIGTSPAPFSMLGWTRTTRFATGTAEHLASRGTPVPEPPDGRLDSFWTREQ